MDTQKKAQLEQRMVIGLLAVFAVTLVMSLRNSGVFSQRVPAPVPAAPAAGAPTRTGSLVETVAAYRDRMEPKLDMPILPSAPEAPVAHSYSAHDARDPFESQLPKPPEPALAQGDSGFGAAPPLMSQRSAGPQLVVQGILWGGTRPTAIINDEVYGIGDVVHGARVAEIDRGGVTLEADGVRMRLTLSGMLNASLPIAP